MTDRIERFLRSNTGSAIAAKLGLVVPELKRFEPGQNALGPVLLGGNPQDDLAEQISSLGATVETTAQADQSYAALVFDARPLTDALSLSALYQFFHSHLRALQANGRIIVIGRPVAQCESAEDAAAQQALEGFTRSVAKEIGNRGSTAQLLQMAHGQAASARSTLSFLLSSRSAFIDGQRIELNPASTATDSDRQQTVLVTGASRGIGLAIAEVLQREGAKVVGVDIPAAEEALNEAMNRLGGVALSLDITAEDAPKRLSELAADLGGFDAVVHNAGVTRDKLLVNMKQDWWDMTLNINLAAAQRINRQLIESGLNDGGRIVGVASMVGISGQRGQTNYSASKAGVIGYVQHMSQDPELKARNITINAVAPGFIETQMTAAIPVMTREVARRLNSLSQGGQPVDVAEAIAWLADPASAAVNGNVLRVCGQNWIGA